MYIYMKGLLTAGNLLHVAEISITVHDSSNLSLISAFDFSTWHMISITGSIWF